MDGCNLSSFMLLADKIGFPALFLFCLAYATLKVFGWFVPFVERKVDELLRDQRERTQVLTEQAEAWKSSHLELRLLVESMRHDIQVMGQKV